MSLRTYLNARGYSKYFIYNDIVPMGSAVWSTPIEDMLDFPAYTLIKFFENHGFLGMNTGLKWRYVRGGSRSYVNCLRREFPEGAFQAGEKVLTVRSNSPDVEVITSSGIKKFDRVIIASHADQALSMLESPDEIQSKLLSAFRYVKNMAVLHTDEKVMPPIRNVWSSWNYKTKLNGDTLRSSTVYYMNRLQKLNSDVNYFVSINDFDAIHPDRIIKSIEYEHPLFDTRAVQAQDSLYRLNLNGPVFFAGAYFKYGFHEDGYQAGVQAAEALLGSVK